MRTSLDDTVDQPRPSTIGQFAEGEMLADS